MKKWISLTLAVLFLLSCGCTRIEEPTDQPMVWFVSEQSASSSALSGELYDGPMDISHLLAALMNGPAEEGHRSPIPVGTTVRSCTREGRLISLDLSGAYGDLTGVELTLANYCITLTLTQLEGVDALRITVNGGSFPYGSATILRREDVLFSGAEEVPVELTAALCFRRPGGNELGVELRVFRLTERESATMAVMEALIEGPDEESLERLLPYDLEVYSARVDDGICYVDFPQYFLETIPEDETEQSLVVRSIAESLCSLGYVQSVQIFVEGESVESYGAVPISEPILG